MTHKWSFVLLVLGLLVNAAQSTIPVFSSSGTSTSIPSPTGLAYYPTTGTAFITSAATNQLFVYTIASLESSGSAASTFGGSGSPSATTFGAIQDVAYDHTRDICYVTDNLWNRVLVFTACSTSASGTAATKVFGQTSFSGTSAGTFNKPYGIAVDSTTGDLYVSDANCKISVFSAAYNLASGTTTASLSLAGTCGCSQTSLNNPRGLSIATINGVNSLIVSDYGNGRLMGWTIPATNGASASFEIGASSFSVCSAGAPAAGNALSGPSDAFVDPTTGTLFVSDTLNNRVLVFASSTYTSALPKAYVTADAVVGQSSLSGGSSGSGSGNLNAPLDVVYLPPSSLNPTDLLVIVDSLNNRVQSFKGNALFASASSTPIYFVSYAYSYSYPSYASYAYPSTPVAASSGAAAGSSNPVGVSRPAGSSKAGGGSAVGYTSLPVVSSFVRPTQVSGGRRGRRHSKKSWKHHKKFLEENFF